MPELENVADPDIQAADAIPFNQVFGIIEHRVVSVWVDAAKNINIEMIRRR